MAALPVPFRPSTAAVVGGIVYALGQAPCLYEEVAFAQDLCPDPDATAGTWTALPSDPLIAAIPRADVQGLGAVWTGGRLLLAAGADSGRGAVRLASLDLASGRWSAIDGVRISAYNLPVLVAGRVFWPGGGTYDPAATVYAPLPKAVSAAAVTAPEIDARHPVPDGLVVGRRALPGRPGKWLL